MLVFPIIIANIIYYDAYSLYKSFDNSIQSIYIVGDIHPNG